MERKEPVIRIITLIDETDKCRHIIDEESFYRYLLKIVPEQNGKFHVKDYRGGIGRKCNPPDSRILLFYKNYLRGVIYIKEDLKEEQEMEIKESYGDNYYFTIDINLTLAFKINKNDIIDIIRKNGKKTIGRTILLNDEQYSRIMQRTKQSGVIADYKDIGRIL